MSLHLTTIGLLVLAPLWINGCDLVEGALEPGFEAELTRTAGCSDLMLYAYNEDSSVALFFSINENLVADAAATGEVTTHVFELTDERINFSVQTGEALTAEVCNDAIEVPSPVHVVRTYRAESGMATLILTPQGSSNEWDLNTLATLQLSDVTLIDETGAADSVVLDSYEMTDVYVGWLPG